VRSLFLAKDLAERCRVHARSYGQYSGALGRLPDVETAHLPRTKDGKISAFPVFLASQEVGAFTSGELRDALSACLDANSRLVTSQLDPKLVLEKLLIRILAR
jgi:DNA polymerase-3 subunit delta